MRIKLINFMGTKSGPNLIRHFLDYYYRLGVDDFFIVLHAENEGDRNRTDALSILRHYGIEPVMDTDDYSCERRKAYFWKIMDEHCDDADWVLTPDLDELHIFPGPLHTFLHSCDEQGFNVVQGMTEDRLAEGGILKKIEDHPSLWEQFPYTGSVTEGVNGGNPRKQSAVKGYFRLCPGSHDVITNEDRVRPYPETIPVHHFKWDDGIVERCIQKFEGRGGDSDNRAMPHNMESVRGFVRHAQAFGRINVPMELQSVPDVSYERAGLATAHPVPEPH